jgi:Na+-transporting methylmalonyl-CoA/oxaloacetate decarboxylase gamma subunit
MLEGLSEGFIVAVANFLLVFLILGGLAGILVALRKVVLFLEKPVRKTTPEPAVVPTEPEPSSQEDQTQPHIVAILAAIHEFTGWPLGSFQIDTIESIQDVPVPAQSHIAAIAAAIHEFTSMPQGALRIVGIRHIGPANAWKMAGRLELMGLDID